MCNWVCVDGRHVQLGLCGWTSCVTGFVWIDVMCNCVSHMQDMCNCVLLNIRHVCNFSYGIS